MLRNSKLSDYYIREIIQCFCIDIPASKAALLLGKNRNTINRWYSIFRQVIYRHQTALKDKLLGRVEVDESYFGLPIPVQKPGRPRFQSLAARGLQQGKLLNVFDWKEIGAG